jgi:hypothetical protein
MFNLKIYTTMEETRQFRVKYAYYNDLMSLLRYMTTMGLPFEFLGCPNGHTVGFTGNTDDLKRVISGARMYGAESKPVVWVNGENWIDSIRQWSNLVASV